MKRDMGICLVIPPSAFLLDERVFMPLGILRVAAVLEKQYPVEVLDLSGIENYEDVVADYLRHSPIRIFGITATTPQMPSVSRITDVIKRESTGSKVILGGPHATLVHAAYRKEKLTGAKGRATTAFADLENRFDVLVAGDGEKAIFRAIEKNAPKLVDADDPKTDLFLVNGDLDVLPWPARHLVDVGSYNYSIEGYRALSLISQLGCPFNCGFCGGRNSPFLRKIRTRSVQNVVAEISHLYSAYGVTGFMFYDDELNVNRRLIVEMMNAIADLQEKLGVEFRLRGFIKSQLFTEEQAGAMYRAGFRWILVGFESGSPRILRNMNKRATREENTRCVEIAGKHNLKVKALMSLGHPGESAETIRETNEWLLEVKPNDFDATIITVYPGTPYYDDAIPHPDREGVWVYSSFGDRLYSQEVNYCAVAEYYKGDPNGGYSSFVWTDFLQPEEIVSLRDHLERDVREKLGIPFNPANPGIRYEHSMGQQGSLPQNILRRST
jgi:radical SAM superfamily enzyme YgiQ (UPF0313 family)